MPVRRTKVSPKAKSPARRTPSSRTTRTHAAAPTSGSVPAAAPDLWVVFARQLQACVDDLSTDDILILARKRANQYVQVHHWGFAMSAEASSNAYIMPPTALLDERQYARAKALGWTVPTITPEMVQELESVGESYEGSPNFHRTFDLGEAGVVELLIKTLREVFKVRCPSELRYKSFTADGSEQIRWTGLGIKREFI